MKTIIDASKGITFRHFITELYRYRYLIYSFAIKDINIRYKQTLLGICWAIFKPLAATVLLYFLFNVINRTPDTSSTNTLYILTGLLPWQFFSITVIEAGNSLISNHQMINKIYFPRAVLPLASLLVNGIDLAIGMILVYIGSTVQTKSIPINIWLIFPYLLFSFVLTAGFSLFFSALIVRFRDLKYVIPFFIQFGLLVSPIGYNPAFIPEHLRLLIFLNPISAIIDGLRFIFFGREYPIFTPGLILSLVITTLIFILGIHVFIKTERKLADII